MREHLKNDLLIELDKVVDTQTLYKKENYSMEDKRTEQIPNNCNECNYTKTCIGHYGGSTCKYGGIIVDIALKRGNK